LRFIKAHKVWIYSGEGNELPYSAKYFQPATHRPSTSNDIEEITYEIRL
jgi:hypothetical protein